MSVDELRLSFCSPLSTSFFLFPFPFFPIVPAAPHCDITWWKNGVQKGHWGGGKHCPLGSALLTAPALSRISSYGLDLSTCRDFRQFCDQWFYIAVILVLENFSLHERIIFLWHEDCFSLLGLKSSFFPSVRFQWTEFSPESGSLLHHVVCWSSSRYKDQSPPYLHANAYPTAYG